MQFESPRCKYYVQFHETYRRSLTYRLLYSKYFPIGCNNKTQELWIIDVPRDKIASIWHETHEDDWPEETWLEYEEWIKINLE